MKAQEAERIVQIYGGIIGNRSKDERVVNVFSLPYSPGKIRYAYFVYTEALIDRGLLTEEVKNQLAITYASLDSIFIESGVEELNQAIKLYAKDQNARKYVSERGGLTAFLPSVEKMTEYNNFVADCFGNWSK